MRLANYTANDLNQYTSRSVPNKADIIGVAYAADAVTVNNGGTYRKGEQKESGTSWHLFCGGSPDDPCGGQAPRGKEGNP